MPAYPTHKIAVLTVKPEKEATDWSKAALAERKWAVKGIVTERSNSHGLIYKVCHQDGSSAWYESRELCLLDAMGEPTARGSIGLLNPLNDGMIEA